MQQAKSRNDKLMVFVKPSLLESNSESSAPWYETPIQVRAGLRWGKRKEALLRWVRVQMVRRLTSHERDCLDLRYFKGLKLDEIARIVETDRGRVHRVLARSIKKLRRAAQEEGLIEGPVD